MLSVIKTLFFTLLFILGITFSMENTQPLTLRYFGYETPPVELYLLVLSSVFLGIILAGVGFIIDNHSMKKSLRQREKEIDTLKREIMSI